MYGLRFGVEACKTSEAGSLAIKATAEGIETNNAKRKLINPKCESSNITKRNPQRRQHHKSVPGTRTGTINGSSTS